MAYHKESDLPVSFIDVSAFSAQIVDTAGNSPVNIVHASHLAAGLVAIRLNWTQVGLLPQFNLLNPNCHWHARVFLEQMGPNEGPAVALPPIVPILQGGPSVVYPPLTIVLPPMPEGVYKPVVTLNLYNGAHTFALFHSHEDFNNIMLEVVAI